MKNRLIPGLSLCLVSWLSICLSSEAAEPKEIIRNKSPDGKFALQITKNEQGSSAAIIDLKGKTGSLDLDIYQNFTDGMHLVWSKDSQRVAYFEPDRRGGSTTVYFLNGDNFETVDLPEFPECKVQAANGEEYVKTIEATTQPQKWLGSDTLVLRVHTDELMEKGDKQRSRACTQIVTVTFDSNHKASVKSAKRVKSE